MMIYRLLALLFAFACVRADDPPADPQADPDPQPELDLDPADPDPAEHDDPPLSDKDAVEAARREAREEGRREAEERYQRELAEARRNAAPRHDDESSREDAKLNDPAVPELEKWQIRANRELRAGRSTAQAALLQAQDVNDRTAFAGISMTDPVAKKYESRVEKELADMRAKGQNAPREAIYTYLLGRDMRDGKFKKKAAPADKGAERKTVDRGRLPGARSDVNARGTQSEHEKRRARLADVQI